MKSSVIRKAQFLTLLITAGIGILVLFQGHHLPLLKTLDKYLSPLETGTITPGSLVEDPNPEKPRQRTLRRVFAPDNLAPDYLICTIDDDPDNINAFGIYHPADIAITLADLQQKGIESIYITTHLRWPDLDLEERATLTTAISKYKHATIATPLRRDPSSTNIPSYLERSSIPAKTLGKTAAFIPQVNALSLPPNIEIPSNTLVGFSNIETIQTNPSSIPLLARWEDRIILNANLLEYLQNLGLAIDDISIRPGQAIRLGNQGNIIPIDQFGQYTPTPLTKESTPLTITSAYSGENSIIGITQKSAILTAKGLKASSYAAIQDPYQTLAEIANTPTVSAEILNNRFPLWLEIILIVDIALLAAFLLAYRSVKRQSIFILILFAIPTIILIISQSTSYSSPVSIYILTILAGYLTTSILAKPARKKYISSTPNATDIITPTSEDEEDNEQEFHKSPLLKNPEYETAPQAQIPKTKPRKQNPQRRRR